MNLQSSKKWAITGVASLCLAACGSMSKKDGDAVGSSGSLTSGANGCVHGTIINGLTGEAISIANFDGSMGVSVLVRDQLVGAGGIGGATTRDLLDGQYAVCGIPTDEDYPLFVRQENYQPFAGMIHIDSTAAPKGTQVKTHLFKTSPEMEANIVLYPVGTRTQDLTFSVVYAGSPVKNATVQLRPTGRNALESTTTEKDGTSTFDSRVLQPRDFRFKTLTAQTDDSGKAIFAKSDLVLGGVYKYVVLPPESLTSASTEVDASGSVIVGMQTTGSGRDPYRYSVALRPMAAELAILQTSTQSQTTSPDGVVSIVFNRPVEIVSPADSIVASLSQNVDAELIAEIPQNMKSDTMDISLSNDGTIIRLSPKFKVQPNSAREPALVINYSAFQVRPASAPMNIKTLAVPAQSVKLFGADTNPALWARTIVKGENTDNQTASPSSVLATPITVNVADQFGIPLKNQTVTFAVQSGSGGVRRPTDTSFQSSLSVTTDNNGVATVYWSLGSSVGKQTLSARVGTLDMITFTANAAN